MNNEQSTTNVIQNKANSKPIKANFRKGKMFNKTEEEDMSGLHLRRVSNKTIIYSVDESSPAQKAGIRANDVILKIGDKNVKAYDMWDIREFLRSGNKATSDAVTGKILFSPKCSYF